MNSPGITTDFVIGSEVSCTDGVCGELSRVVVDPVARTLTHLVVEPKRALGHGHGQSLGHLVPVGLTSLVDTGTEHPAIRLSCSNAEFDALEDAQETTFIPGISGQWSYPEGRVLAWPYYGTSGSMGIGTGADLDVGMGIDTGPHAIVADRVPPGEVEVRRGDPVHATDGQIGDVAGLVIDRVDHHVTHVLLHEGHLWGRKQVAIPIGAVTKVDDGIRLTLTKDAVRDLPAIELDGETSASHA